MKKTALLILLATFSLTVFGQKKKKEKFHNVYGYSPITSTYYVGNNEVTISEWLSYIMDKVESDAFTQEEALALLPSNEYQILSPYINAFREGLAIHFNGESCATCEKSRDGFGPNYVLLFPSDKADEMKKRWKFYRYIPVTGITFDQAQAYIEWLQPHLENYSFRKGGNIKLRLPTPEESTELLKNNTVGTLAQGQVKAENDTINPKGCYLFNFHALTPCPSSEGQLESYGYTDGMVSTFSYWPSSMGLYSLYGNAAEMTSKVGIAKGGSFKHWAKECNAQNEFKYDGPKDWVGFRIVADIVPPKK